MKKLLISLLLSSSALFAAPIAMANSQFSALQMAQVQLDSLSFKNIMRQFYPNSRKTSGFSPRI